MTIKKLYGELSKLIAAGYGRSLVVVSKTTFNHPCESDGVTMLPVESVKIELVNITDGDGGIRTTKTGKEIKKKELVLYGV